MDGFQFLDTASKAAETFLHKYFRDVHSLEGLGVELLAHYVQFYKKLPDISKWLEHCTCLPTMVECRHSTSCQHLILSVQFGHSGGCAVLPHCNLICTFLKTNDCGWLFTCSLPLWGCVHFPSSSWTVSSISRVLKHLWAFAGTPPHTLWCHGLGGCPILGIYEKAPRWVCVLRAGSPVAVVRLPKASGSPGGLVKSQNAEIYTQSFWFSESGLEPENLVFSEHLHFQQVSTHDIMPLVLGPPCENHCFSQTNQPTSQQTLSSLFLVHSITCWWCHLTLWFPHTHCFIV